MIKKMLLVVMALVLASTPGMAKEVAGVDMPDSMSVGKVNLIFNGAGLLKIKFPNLDVDVYVVGLYLKNKSSDAMKIINSDETMAVKLHNVGDSRPEDYSDGFLKGFNKSCKNLGIDQKSIEKDIKLFLNILKDGMAKNDIFDFTYSNTNGIQVFKNKNRTPMVTIKNITFKRALFGFWLTDRPEDNRIAVRKALLGL